MTSAMEFLNRTRLELGPAADQTTHPWRRAEADGIAWLVLNCEASPVNTVTEDVLTGLDAALRDLAGTPPRGVVIRSAKAGGFAAGADIDSFDRISGQGAVELLEQGHAVLDRLASLPCPTIAITHGAALGAGFEIALACDHRIAIDGAKFAFPEVNLGLHPGLGGTFRLTGLIDPIEAMTLMLTGKSAHTEKAKKLGIVDVVTRERHVRAAVEAIIDGKVDPSVKGLKSRALALHKARSLAATRMRAETAKKAPSAHFPAPYALIDLWEAHGGDRNAMQKAEIASFARLLDSETSRNLRRVFFLQQGLKQAGRGDDGIAHVHVIGAGEMGAAIAAWAAIRGKRVTLADLEPKALARAIRQAAQICRDSHLGGIETRDALDRLMPDPKGYGCARADLVIEAVPEDAALKARIHREAAGRMRKNAILATNTSSLSLTELARAVPDPAHFAGLHFFNPVARMQLVEVIGHASTTPEVMDRLAAFCGAIDRLPVLLHDYPGFLVNRALVPYLMEAMVLMDEGVPKEVIDRAALDFGMPMGPVALADQVGLDICLDVAESLKLALKKPIPEISPRLRKKVKAGETGKKAGRGFYDWSDGTPRPETAQTGPEDLQDRLFLPMLDACMECLRRGVARDADQVDGAMIFATGFAPFRAGPMHYANTRGINEIRHRLDELADRHGERFRPDPGWSE